MASLQEQLMQAGIVDKKQAKKIDREKRKAAKTQPKGHAKVDETREQAQRALAEKAERARELNRQQQAQAHEKAIRAQVIQLIRMNRIEHSPGDVPYQFTDGKKIKKKYVSAKMHEDLSQGRVAIARLDGGYELIPAAAARKVMQRDEDAIVLLNDGQADAGGSAEDDPYAAYQIPDDLMW